MNSNEDYKKTHKYKGFEIFSDPSYYSMFACRKKGVTNFDETAHFKTVDEAKRFVDKTLNQKHSEAVLNSFINKSNDSRVYTIIVDKFDNKTKDCVNIENINLQYVDLNSHHGLQCNHLQSESNGKYERIFEICGQISKLMVELNKLNNE